MSTEAIPRRAPTSRRMWWAWAVLSTLALGAFAAGVFSFRLLDPAEVSVAQFWVFLLRYEVAPHLGIAALVMPPVALISLLLRRWRPAMLGILAFTAIALALYIAFEHALLLHNPWPPTGPDDWMPVQ